MEKIKHWGHRLCSYYNWCSMALTSSLLDNILVLNHWKNKSNLKENFHMLLPRHNVSRFLVSSLITIDKQFMFLSNTNPLLKIVDPISFCLFKDCFSDDFLSLLQHQFFLLHWIINIYQYTIMLLYFFV